MRALSPSSRWALKQGGGAGVAAGLHYVVLSVETYQESSSYYSQCPALPGRQAYSLCPSLALGEEERDTLCSSSQGSNKVKSEGDFINLELQIKCNPFMVLL